MATPLSLKTDVKYLKGVGPKTVPLLARLGIKNVEDLLDFFPYRYEDYSKITKISDITPGAITITGTLKNIKTRRIRARLHITQADIYDGDNSVRAVWFNQPWISTSLKESSQYFASGLYEYSGRAYSLQNPTVELVSEIGSTSSRIIPVYRQTKGITSKQIRRVVSQALDLASSISSFLPTEINPIAKSQVIQTLHSPKNMSQLKKAQDYMKQEELFTLLLASHLAREEEQTLTAHPIEFDKKLTQQVIANQPFELTDAQKKVTWDVLSDISKTRPMNRLVQGDVGSGKTIVAGIATAEVLAQNKQVAILAPTSILAAQHAESFSEILQPLGFDTALVLGGKSKAKSITLDKIKQGKVLCVVGTHALLEETTLFSDLGLVVIDEQHRFGVKQRARLQTKTKKMPHLLSMSATPIPRTIALTLYGELDISTISQMPKGRKPVITKIITQNKRPAAYNEIQQQLNEGRQMYVICPLIEESDTLGVQSVEQTKKHLESSQFKTYRIGVLHGRMKPVEKDRIMNDFAKAELDILISTTVVEVGVNVANASIMMIEGAERFGLAQLHQLRGRIIRGTHQGTCYVFPTQDVNISNRLKAIEKTSNGFALAELDLKLRGPGSIYHVAQSGDLDLRFAKISDTELIASMQKQVAEYYKNNAGSIPAQLKNDIKRARAITQLN